MDDEYKAKCLKTEIDETEHEENQRVADECPVNCIEVVEKKDCVFCDIVNGDIPCTKYYEDERFLAFFDIKPICEGHLILISKNHYDNVQDMPEDEFRDFMVLGRELAVKLMEEKEMEGYNLLVNQGEAGESLVCHRPHLHILVRRKGDSVKLDPR